MSGSLGSGRVLEPQSRAGTDTWLTAATLRGSCHLSGGPSLHPAVVPHSRLQCVTARKRLDALGRPVGIQGVFIALLYVHKRMKEGITALRKVSTQCMLRATEWPRGLVWSAQQQPVVSFNDWLLQTASEKTQKHPHDVKVSTQLLRVLTAQSAAGC